MKSETLSRRTLIRNTSLAAAGAVAAVVAPKLNAVEIDMDKVKKVATKGRINQSVSKWCFGKWSLDQLCEVSKGLGLN